MEKLLKLFSLCQAEVIITHNGHKTCYETVDDYISGWGGNGGRTKDIAMDVYMEMVKRDTVIELQYYPHTPIGFHLIFHYDLEKALDIALAGWAETAKTE